MILPCLNPSDFARLQARGMNRLYRIDIADI